MARTGFRESQLTIRSTVATDRAWNLYNFKFYFTLLSKHFSPFPRGTCALSVSHSIFSLGRNLSPVFRLQSQAILLATMPSIRGRDGRFWTGLSPSLVSQRNDGINHNVKATTQSQGRHLPHYNSGRHTRQPKLPSARFRHGLFPVHSPLLRESWLVSIPLPINMLKFSR